MARRLAAILAADVVGYSKLMAEDEAGTLAALKAQRAEVFDPTVARHQGRIVKLMGDGVLVEFASVVDAVACALEVQRTLAQDPDQSLRLRIGINLGDVMPDGDDLYGDGVNVAARLEALAEPGGLCISSIVHESLGSRIEARFADAGEQRVKNIERPIRIYLWQAEEAGGAPGEALAPAELKQKPTIRILPFENRTKDDEMGFLCQGLAEDIATALGAVDQLTVVAHQADPGHSPQSARYSLEGSLRKAGTRVRVSAQLIDGFTGIQSWAERYDRDAEDLFQVQDDVARQIVIALHTTLGAGSYTNRWQLGTENFQAWQLQAKAFHLFQTFSPDSMARCAEMWDQAAALDPDYLAPRAAASYCYAHMALWADPATQQAYLAKAQAAVDQIAEVAPRDSRPLSALRGIEIAKGNYEAAIAAAQKALDLEPNEASCRANLAHALAAADRPAEALAQITKATLDIPNYPGWFAQVKILALIGLNRLAPALAEADDIMARAPAFYGGPPLAAALLVQLDRLDEARAMAERVRQMDPQFSRAVFIKSLGLKNQALRDGLSAAVEAAGLEA